MVGKLFKNSLAKNTILLMIVQISNYIIPWLSLPYLGRILGVNCFGELVLLMSAMQVCNIVVDYGFGLSATYYIAKNRNNKDSICKHISAVFINKLLLMLIVVPFFFIYIAYAKLEILWGVLCLFNVFFMSVQPVFLFQGIEKMRNITIISLTSKLAYIFIILLLVKGENDIYLVFAGLAVGNLIAFVLSMLMMFHEGYWLAKPTYQYIWTCFIDSAEFFVSRVAVAVYTTSSALIVGMFCGVQQAAYYSVAEKFYIAMQNLTSPLSQAAYPYMIKTGNKRLYLIVTLLFGMAISTVSLFIFIFSKEIIYVVFGNDFLEAATILKLFCICIVVNFIAVSFGYPMLSAVSKVYIANRSVVFGAINHTLILLGLYYFDFISPVNVVISIVCTEVLVSYVRVKAVLK